MALEKLQFLSGRFAFGAERDMIEKISVDLVQGAFWPSLLRSSCEGSHLVDFVYVSYRTLED